MYGIIAHYRVHERSWRRADQENLSPGCCATPVCIRLHHPDQREALFGGRCTRCPLRERCTTAKAWRTLTIRPHHDLMADARRRAATDATWRADYRR
ncbi:transposase [Nonomuraea spiralis]|uniref:Transposase n=1 Tax=Nonomuraea spiralis TaxID=46182 RepID=A0ABV5IRN0_9ACTN|nr:transposase [Nonomuraea spiralis]GGT42771.1 hypothetical protein GCM10010176_102860 [Nonomuraea spiralis]